MKKSRAAQKVGREKVALREPTGKKMSISWCLIKAKRPVVAEIDGDPPARAKRAQKKMARLWPNNVVSIEVATIFRARYSAREKS